MKSDAVTGHLKVCGAWRQRTDKDCNDNAVRTDDRAAALKVLFERVPTLPPGTPSQSLSGRRRGERAGTRSALVHTRVPTA
eukprot:4782605-Pleurochrysis_carterae.AAC.4